jgi:hypothetical protein
MGKAEDLPGNHDQMIFSSEDSTFMIFILADVIRLNDVFS